MRPLFRNSNSKEVTTKVFILEPVGGHGGNEYYTCGLAQFLQRCGWNVILHTCDRTDLDQLCHFDFELKKTFVGIYGKDSSVLRGLRYLTACWRIYCDCLNNQPAVIHCHIYHFSLREFLLLVSKFIGRSKLVLTVHDVDSFDNRAQRLKGLHSMMRWLQLQFASQVITHSEFAASQVRLVSLKKNNVSVVTHGDTDFINGDVSKWDRKSSCELLGLESSLSYILFFGQIKEVKGLDILLKAFALVRNRENIKLIVAGKFWKAEKSKYLQIVKDHGIESSVIFESRFIPTQEVPHYYVASDIICLPYREIYSSGVLLRSLAYGKPVVCSDHQVLRNVVQDGENGLLFRSEDETSLARAIERLILSRALQVKLQKNGLKTIRQFYSWDIVAKETSRVYRQALV